MTTLTATKAPTRKQSRSPLVPHGLTWTLLRVHRSTEAPSPHLDTNDPGANDSTEPVEAAV